MSSNDLWLVYVHAPTKAATPGLEAVSRIYHELGRRGKIVNSINVPLGLLKGEVESPIIGVPGPSVQKTFIVIEPLGRRLTQLRALFDEHASLSQDRFIVFGAYSGRSRTGHSVGRVHWTFAPTEEALLKKLM